MILRLFIICFSYLLLLALLMVSVKKFTFISKNIFYFELIILSLSLYLHLFLAILSPIGDSRYFAQIMTQLTTEDFFGFYETKGITYPPLFNYLFYFYGNILRMVGIPFDKTVRTFVFCVKIPGIFCEFMMAGLIYRISKKYLTDNQRIIALFLILLNPGYLFITSYICQIDALYSFFIFLTLYLIVEKHLKLSYFSFAAAILLKFQSVFITPVLIFAIIDQVILNDFNWKRFFTHLGTGLSAIACMAVSYLPFIYDFENHVSSEGGLTYNFTSSIASYGKASQNAYNFWTLTGYNEIPISESFGPFSCNTWGTLFLIILVALSVFFYLRKRDDIAMYPMLAALLVSGTYCFAVKMMSRYLYPAIILLLLGYVMKPTLQRLLCTISFTIGFFLVVGFDYLVYPWKSYTKDLILPYLISFYVIVCFGLLFYTLWKETSHDYAGIKKA
ncbi:MAG: hypothetical protein ACI4C5_07675 [Lachnospiraceae bacterium]